jgi:hypothetical protein
VTIVEAQGLLGTFDDSLRAYALKKLMQAGVEIIEKVRIMWIPDVFLVHESWLSNGSSHLFFMFFCLQGHPGCGF